MEVINKPKISITVANDEKKRSVCKINSELKYIKIFLIRIIIQKR